MNYLCSTFQDFRNWIIALFVILLEINFLDADDKITTYSVHELFAKCSQTNQTISMHDEWIFAGKIVYTPTDVQSSCNDRDYELTINADYSERLEDLRLMFRVETENNYGTPVGNNSVCHLQIYDGSTLNKNFTFFDHNFHTPETFVTTGALMILKLKSLKDCHFHWAVTFTAYHTGLCHSYEYMCANKRCIFHSLSCNGNDPCGDLSDCAISPAAYATIALGGFCALGVLFLILYVIVKSRKTSVWSSREPRKYKFSATKALEGIQSFTPATVSIEPLKRRWSCKY